jgi:hypothetical protein
VGAVSAAVSEALGLNWADVGFAHGYLRMPGATPRTVPGPAAVPLVLTRAAEAKTPSGDRLAMADH